MPLEEMFPEARIQMVSSVINKSGSVRKLGFSRCIEYIYFVMFGESSPSSIDFDISGINKENDNKSLVTWQYLRRRASNIGALRIGRPGLFYPIFIDKKTSKIHSIGNPLPKEQNRKSIDCPAGTWAAFPLKPDGEEGCWQISKERLEEQLNDGTCFLSSVDESKEQAQILYLKSGDRNKVLNGEVNVIGKEPSGKLIIEGGDKKVRPKDIWMRDSHDATSGSVLLNTIFHYKNFSFPKSLYAVHDTLRFFVANKPNALILDFFAGSGTTLHAVNLLNAEDGGNRRCIMVTNNEVSEQEAKTLTKQGYKPGDEEWERLGIARYVNWPRTVCSIEGHDVNGQPLKGEYLGKDHRQMKDGFEANCIFFKLNFLDKGQVALGRQFHELLPILWMKAGGEGPCPQLDNDEIPQQLILPENRFAVLTDEKAFTPFMESVIEYCKIRMVYLVVDSDYMYREMARCFPNQQTCQLYRDYLDNFRINQTR